MIKQNKGKDLHKVPKSRLVDGPYYVSKKFDGHYVQIQYKDGQVKMWTSGGKEFYLENLAIYIEENFTEDFHIECEFNYGCLGKLGDRGKSAKLTTYRTNLSKGIVTKGDSYKDLFTILDLLDVRYNFEKRLNNIVDMFYGDDWFRIPIHTRVYKLSTAQVLAESYIREGYEGAMLKAPGHVYQSGKRTNDIIKIKHRLTADLLCIGWKMGTGKYEGMIGALELRDSEGRTVWAGSGLNDTDRAMDGNYYKGKVIEIEYERIDETYIQPIIKQIRLDKTAEEID